MLNQNFQFFQNVLLRVPDALRLAPPVPVQRVREEHVRLLRHRARPHVRETERGRERAPAPPSDRHHAPDRLLR